MFSAFVIGEVQIFENYFDCPGLVVAARLVDLADRTVGLSTVYVYSVIQSRSLCRTIQG